ncbi:hypothetical protein QEN19_000330 [Hanseniaspora menglaensis]
MDTIDIVPKTSVVNESSNNKISINNLMNEKDVSPVKKEKLNTGSTKDEETDTDDEANVKKAAENNEEKGVEFNNVDFNYDDDDDDEDASRNDDSFKSEDFELDDEEEEIFEEQILPSKEVVSEKISISKGLPIKSNVDVTSSIIDTPATPVKSKLSSLVDGSNSIGENLSSRESAKIKKRSIVLDADESKQAEEKTPVVKKAKKTATPVAKREEKFEEKTSIKDDLARLSKLSEQNGLKKTKEVPIWARKWVPKAKENLVAAKIETDHTGETAPMPVQHTQLNYGLNSEGIPINFKSSYLNTEPDCDIVQAIQQWIYAQLVSIPIEDRSYVEIELKFGKLTGDNEVDRINLPISTETIYTNIDGHLLPTIDESLFKELIKHMITTTDNNSDFNIMESEMVDSIYRINDFYNHKRPRFLRLSKDYKTGRIFEFIEKKNLSNLLIYTPRDAYDMKLSLNLEVPMDSKDEPPEKFANETPIHLRRKKRCSYIHNDSYTRFDLTEVVNKKQSAMSNDSDGSKIHNTFEVELELNAQVLVKCIDYIGKDSTKFATLVRNFIHNGQLLRRKMTQLSGEIFQGKKKV